MSEVGLTTSEDHLTAFIQAELSRARADWDALKTPECPEWTWEDLKEALLLFATTPTEELVMRGVVSGRPKQAAFKTPDGVLEDLFRLVGAAQDLSFRRSASAMLEGDGMT